MEFEKRAIRSLSNMFRSIEKADYRAKDIQVHHEWIMNPTSYVHFLRGLPGAEYFVSHELSIRRVDLSGDFCPENLRLHCQPSKRILFDSQAVILWLDLIDNQY